MQVIEIQRLQKEAVPPPADIVLILLLSFVLLDHAFTALFATAQPEGGADDGR
jgi:hypothetical protein